MSSDNKRRAWMDLRGAVLAVPIMLRVALRSPDDRTEAVGVARVARQLYWDAVKELGEVEAEDLVGATLRYVRDRVMAVYGDTAWDADTMVVEQDPALLATQLGLLGCSYRAICSGQFAPVV